MNRYKSIGYVSLIIGVILFALSIIIYQMYAEENLMLETFVCISSSCFSRASIFMLSMIIGCMTLFMGLVILAEDLYEKINRRSK